MTESRTDTEELPYLVRLLDDDSATVRQAVGERLFAMRGNLEEELRGHGISLTDGQRSLVDDLRVSTRRTGSSSRPRAAN